jgi:hypothetical protein
MLQWQNTHVASLAPALFKPLVKKQGIAGESTTVLLQTQHHRHPLHFICFICILRSLELEENQGAKEKVASSYFFNSACVLPEIPLHASETPGAWGTGPAEQIHWGVGHGVVGALGSESSRQSRTQGIGRMWGSRGVRWRRRANTRLPGREGEAQGH